MWILTLAITIRPNDLEIPWYASFAQQPPCHFTFLHSIFFLLCACIFLSSQWEFQKFLKNNSEITFMICSVGVLSGTWQSAVSYWEIYSAQNRVKWQFIAVFTYPTKSFPCIFQNVQICFFHFRELYLVCWCNVTVTALIYGKEITCPTYLA